MAPVTVKINGLPAGLKADRSPWPARTRASSSRSSPRPRPPPATAGTQVALAFQVEKKDYPVPPTPLAVKVLAQVECSGQWTTADRFDRHGEIRHDARSSARYRLASADAGIRRGARRCAAMMAKTPSTRRAPASQPRSKAPRPRTAGRTEKARRRPEKTAG